MTITYYNQLLTIIESNLHLISILKQELFLNHRPRAPQIPSPRQEASRLEEQRLREAEDC